LRELIKTIKALEGFWGILFGWAGVVRDIASCKGGVNKKAQQIRGEPPAIQKQRQPAKTAPVAESSNKYRQYQASKAQTINCYCAEQLLYYRTKKSSKTNPIQRQERHSHLQRIKPLNIHHNSMFAYCQQAPW
jgi:hypothetical protein